MKTQPTDPADDQAVQTSAIRKIRLKDRRSTPARYSFFIDGEDI